MAKKIQNLYAFGAGDAGFKACLRGVKNISMHGTCCDSNCSSADKMIAEVVEKRFGMSCEAAMFYGIKNIVFHSSICTIKTANTTTICRREREAPR